MFKSLSGQLSIATSKNLSVVNTICISLYIYIYIYICIYIYHVLVVLHYLPKLKRGMALLFLYTFPTEMFLTKHLIN